MMFEHAGFDLPPGFLWCDGAAVSRTAQSRLFAQLTRSATGTTANGSSTITSVSADLTSQIKAGMPISGPGIPAGATVTAVTANTITISANATASAGGQPIVIAPWGVGDGSTTFNVPDRRGRVGAGRDDMGGTAASRLTTAGSGVNGLRLGASGGAETHTLTQTQMPAHNHALNGQLYSFTAPPAGSGQFIVHGGVGSGPSTDYIAGGGSGQAHNNTQPTVVVNYIIKT